MTPAGSTCPLQASSCPWRETRAPWGERQPSPSQPSPPTPRGLLHAPPPPRRCAPCSAGGFAVTNPADGSALARPGAPCWTGCPGGGAESWRPSSPLLRRVQGPPRRAAGFAPAPGGAETLLLSRCSSASCSWRSLGGTLGHPLASPLLPGDARAPSSCWYDLP